MDVGGGGWRYLCSHYNDLYLRTCSLDWSGWTRDPRGPALHRCHPVEPHYKDMNIEGSREQKRVTVSLVCVFTYTSPAALSDSLGPPSISKHLTPQLSGWSLKVGSFWAVPNLNCAGDHPPTPFPEAPPATQILHLRWDCPGKSRTVGTSKLYIV